MAQHQGHTLLVRHFAKSRTLVLFRLSGKPLHSFAELFHGLIYGHVFRGKGASLHTRDTYISTHTVTNVFVYFTLEEYTNEPGCLQRIPFISVVDPRRYVIEVLPGCPVSGSAQFA